jgi:ACS family tartrate transporter-like MFS transporter
MIVAGLMYGVLIVAQHTLFLAISALLVGSGILYAFYPVFWSIPTMILSESAAAATLGLITTISQIGGFAGPYAIGFLNDRTHSLTAGFGFIALAYVAAGSFLLAVKIEYSPNTVKPKWKFGRSKSALTGQVNGSNV